MKIPAAPASAILRGRPHRVAPTGCVPGAALRFAG